jgi:glycine/D-amino acid oxidase-like deaminating enzyme
MRRRRFLSLSAGAAAVGAATRGRSEGRPKVLVVGAGIVGASIAYHLARRGAEVMVCERERPAAGATGNSFAWINATFSKQPRPYYELNLAGMAAWRALDLELEGALGVQWGGSVEWYPPGPEAEQLRADLRRHAAWGYAAHALDGEKLRVLVPELWPGSVAVAAWSEHEGWVDPVHATRALLARAELLGARVFHPCAVLGFDGGKDSRGEVSGARKRSVRTTMGPTSADVVVLASGVDTPTLAAEVGLHVPLKESPGVLAHSAPLPHRLKRVVLAPGAHVVQRADGRVVTGSSFGGTPQVAADATVGAGLLREASRFLPFLDGAAVERVSLGRRVLPRDELPVLGFSEGSPGVYLAVMHSGVTLAPLVGRLATAEILDGVAVDALEPFRLSRFA